MVLLSNFFLAHFAKKYQKRRKRNNGKNEHVENGPLPFSNIKIGNNQDDNYIYSNIIKTDFRAGDRYDKEDHRNEKVCLKILESVDLIAAEAFI